jgi:signal transduction histidine kinase/ActR/RegA family two-component response regulator
MNNNKRSKKAGEELVRLSSFPELNPYPVVEADAEGRVFFANPAAKRLFPGLIKNGRSHEWLSDWLSTVKTLKTDPEKPITRDVAVGEKYFQQTLYYIEEHGRIRMYGMDITERRIKEEARNNFIALMSHELRNPLTPIISGIQLIRSHLNKKLPEPALPPFIEESFSVIENQTNNMARLLGDLLDISRISRGTIKLQKKNINIGDYLKKAEEAARPLINSQKHSLIITLPERPIFIFADPIRFEQIFINLLNNAAKYTPPGGKIRLEAKKQGQEVEITVSDNGIGIEQEKLDSLFNMFVGSAIPFTSTYGELGIGLKLIKDLVTMHGGIITPKSSGINKGAEFTVSFPILNITKQEKTEKKPKENPRLDKPARKLRVLAVDDNETITTLFSHALALFGHETVTCNNSFEAVETARRCDPHVAMIDIGMPGMDGYAVALELRKYEKENGKPIKLIAVTGFGQESDIKRAMEAGFDLHLTKPVELDTLEKALNDLFK